MPETPPLLDSGINIGSGIFIAMVVLGFIILSLVAKDKDN